MTSIRVELRRAPGVAGRSLHVVMDSGSLPDDQAAQLVRLVRALDLTRLGAELCAPCEADLLRYELTIRCGPRHWRGTVAEPTVPAELRPLLRFMTELVPG